jgi:S1-C subfamily serine protease
VVAIDYPEIAMTDGLGLKGALVASVAGDSPADKAGLKSGDAILAVNGQSIADACESSRDIAALKPGDKASLYRRGAIVFALRLFAAVQAAASDCASRSF